MAYKHILFFHHILPFIYSFTFFFILVSFSLFSLFYFAHFQFLSIFFSLAITGFFSSPLSPFLFLSVLLFCSSICGSSKFRKLVMCVDALDLKPFSHLCRLRSFSIQLAWHFFYIFIYYYFCFFFLRLFSLFSNSFPKMFSPTKINTA